MKKILAGVTALIIMGTLFTGCGQVGGSDDEKESTSSSETASEKEADSEEKRDGDSSEDASVTEDSSEDSADTSSESSESSAAEPSEDYEEALKKYFEAVNNSDYENLVRMMYPTKVVDSLIAMSSAEGTDLFSQIGAPKGKYVITNITKEGEMTSDELDTLMQTLDQLAVFADKIEEYGGDVNSLTDEQREELFKAVYTDDASAADGKHKYTVTKGYDVTVSYTRDGEEDEDSFYIYYIDGEGWKMESSMRKYVKKSRQASLNSTAKSIFNAVAITMADLESDGADLNGSYIIGSDDSMTYNVPSSLNVADIRKSAEEYFDDIKDYDYFVVILDGACSYIGVYKDTTYATVGTYPVFTIPKAVNDGHLETESEKDLDKYSLEELFAMAKKIIG